MQKAQTIHLTNALGTTLTLTNVGASLMALHIKDRAGQWVNVVAGLKDATAYAQAAYQNSRLCLGASIGRYAGRISNGGFTLDTTFYPLETQGGFHLHGGSRGFQNQIWELVKTTKKSNAKAVFKLQDPEGEYPGNLTVFATYELLDTNQLSILYTATTDKKTILNMANHAYFNLNGTGTICDHELQIDANKILETNALLIPSGRYLDVADVNCDYTKPRAVKAANFKGLDTVFVLNDKTASVGVKSLKTGISMQVITNQRAVVVYTPPNFNAIDLAQPNTADFPAICFEAQNFPDAPNQPDFPSAVLLPGETYNNLTQYTFTVQ